MKGIPELRLKTLLPDHLRYDFMVQMDTKCVDRMQIISWLGVVLYVCLFILDYMRAQAGEFDRRLFYFHLCGGLYILPALLTTFASEQVKATRISRGVVIWFTFLLTTVALFGQAFVTFEAYNSLTMYMTYVIVANWTFTMNHNQRVLFNLACIVLMLSGIIMNTSGDNVRFMIKIYEVVFFTSIAFIFGLFDYNLRAAKFLEERELVREKGRIEELEMLKSRMYTNLTHEFRTPLTVIAGMASQIQVNPAKWGGKGAEMIRRNSARILNLVNQILDLSKLESGSMALKLVNGDVITNLRYIIDSFQSYAESKQIRLHFLTDLNELHLDYDPEKSLTVISNLLSNAIKYTPDGGHIYIRANKIETPGGPRFEIWIRDTGIGIPEEKLGLIFDRFYQIEDRRINASAGTGIGLAIVKELVKLMEGNIRVTSKVGVGTEFVLDFPIKNDVEVAPAQFVPASIITAVSSWLEPPVSDTEKPVALLNGLQETTRILVIEDNSDVVAYISTILKGEYTVTTEHDGDKGIDRAIRDVPDLVITDLMMPGKDGYEVCRALKQDDRTSHVPIIMLTAKADRESKISGLKSGADIYLPKPFDQEELLAQVKQLIEQRKKLQERYLVLEGTNGEVRPEHHKEDLFIGKVREAIHARMNDSTFGILQLCRIMGMSRTQLHNKLKAVTGKSASHYIRSVRLEVAQKLLREDDLTIAEIAYSTGFTDPGYFSRVYREEFGEAPSEFRE